MGSEMCIRDSSYNGLSIEEVVTKFKTEDRWFAFVADEKTFTSEEITLLVVDLDENPGANFRTVLSEVAAIENNLSIANMDFEEFADSVDEDGVFRGF